MTPDSKSMEKMLEKLLILDFARQGFVAPGAFGTGNTTANSNVTSTPISQLGVGTLSFGIKTNSSGGSKASGAKSDAFVVPGFRVSMANATYQTCRTYPAL